mmetsp:Transcript_4760/g.8428  ORF Transcript_4760/g.8428 Transcript_4760/m.8428 type:complete len:474 (-) Transcript_4760:116-1537(-)
MSTGITDYRSVAVTDPAHREKYDTTSRTESREPQAPLNPERLSKDFTPEEERLRLAGARLIGGLKLKDRTVIQIERGSVYGAVILMPQVARTLGWPEEIMQLSVCALLYHIVCVIVHGWLLTFIEKEEKVVDAFAGQMYLCDFGAHVDNCEEHGGCIGPGGTEITAPRLYSWSQWATRNFVRSSFEAMFPDRMDDVAHMVDPGEYGVESYWCRLLCVIVFVLSIIPEFTNCIRMFELLWFAPSESQPWVNENTEVTERMEREKEEETSDKWLDMVEVRVAGMSRIWKSINFVLVFVPKCWLLLYTLKAGTGFLMETAGVDDIIVNSVALGFLLGLDELITEAMLSVEARTLLELCEDLTIESTGEEKDSMLHSQILEKYHDGQRFTGSGWLSFFKGLFLHKFLTLYLVAGLSAYNIWVTYYWNHCEYKDGRWVSKPMFGPKKMALSWLNAFLAPFFPLETFDKPYWTMPEPEH